MGGRYLIGISAENRTLAGVGAGGVVDVHLVLDTEPRVVTVPDDLAAALEREPVAGEFFRGLTYNQQREHVQAIESAKSSETRQRRLEKSLDLLRQRRRR